MSSTKKVASNKARALEKKTAYKQTCLLVLGMHRSGTSALTRTLSLMGAALPKDIMGVSSGNNTGHWESNRIVQYNDRLLSELQSNWQDWTQLDFSRVSIKRKNEIKKELSDIIRTEYEQAPLIVLKDPRICRFSDFFLQMLVDANILPVCIHVFRNPLEVAQSLNSRDGMVLGRASLLWLRHVLEAEKASRGYARVFNSYSELLGDWRQFRKKLDKTHRVKFPYKADEVSAQIGTFLKPKLKHNAATPEDLILNPLTRDWINSAYEAFLVLSQNPDSRAAMDVLDGISVAFNAAAPTMQHAFGDLEQAYKDNLQKVNTERDGVFARLNERKAETERLRQKLSERSDEGKQLKAMLSERKAETERLRQELSERGDESERLKATLSERNNEIETFRQIQGVAKKEVNKMRSALSIGDKKAILLEREIKYSRQSLSSKKNDNRDLKHIVDAHLKERDGFIQKTKNLEHSVEQKVYAITEMKQDLLSRVSEVKTLEDNLKKLRLQLAQGESDRKDEVGRLQVDITNKTDRVKKLSLEIQDVRFAFQNSLSWKVTKSLRVLMRFMRKTKSYFSVDRTEK